MATTQQPDEFSSSGVLHSLEQDPFLKQFVAAVDVSRLASRQMDNIEPSLAKLQNGIALVNRKIRQEVALHEGALLEQAAHIAMLEDALRTAKEGTALGLGFVRVLTSLALQAWPGLRAPPLVYRTRFVVPLRRWPLAQWSWRSCSLSVRCCAARCDLFRCTGGWRSTLSKASSITLRLLAALLSWR
jgi:hypothetical protein